MMDGKDFLCDEGFYNEIDSLYGLPEQATRDDFLETYYAPEIKRVVNTLQSNCEEIPNSGLKTTILQSFAKSPIIIEESKFWIREFTDSNKSNNQTEKLEYFGYYGSNSEKCILIYLDKGSRFPRISVSINGIMCATSFSTDPELSYRCGIKLLNDLLSAEQISKREFEELNTYK